jgi:hypothetical protein
LNRLLNNWKGNAAYTLPQVLVDNTDTSAFPNFYQIFISGSSPALSNLNTVGRIQRNLVYKIMSVAKNYPNVFFEIMNETRTAGAGTNTEMANWTKAIITWVRATGNNPSALVSVSVDESVSAATDPKFTSVEKAILGIPSIDMISLHHGEWRNGPNDPSPNAICTAINKYSKPRSVGGFGRSVIIDTDGAKTLRENNTIVSNWLNATMNCTGIPKGVAHFNHKDFITVPTTTATCLDCNALRLLDDITGRRPKYTGTETYCNSH